MPNCNYGNKSYDYNAPAFQGGFRKTHRTGGAATNQGTPGAFCQESAPALAPTLLGQYPTGQGGVAPTQAPAVTVPAAASQTPPPRPPVPQYGWGSVQPTFIGQQPGYTPSVQIGSQRSYGAAG